MVILTALRLEYDAVRQHLTDVVQEENDSGTVFDCGWLADTGWWAALALIGQGNIAAAVITEQARAKFQPTALLFVGVAGSLKDDVKIGDVVIGDRIYAYHSEKHDPGVSLVRPRVWDASHRLLQRALRVNQAPGFQVHHKPIAAGEVVLNDPRSALKEQLEHHYNDAVAIEMESAGVSHAAHVSGVHTLTIRGISDKADGRKHAADAGGKQRLAAEHAAHVAVEVLREARKGLGPQGENAPKPPLVSEPSKAAHGAGGGQRPTQTVGLPAGALPPPPPGTTGASPDSTVTRPLNGPSARTARRGTGLMSGVTPPSQSASTDEPDSDSSSQHTRRQKPARPPSELLRAPALLFASWRWRSAALTVLGIVTLTLVIALLGALLTSGGGKDDGDDGVNTTSAVSALKPCPAAQADVTLRIAASVDLSTSLGEAAAGYGARQADGRCVKVVVDGVNSGTGMRALARGWTEDDGPEPDVWSPAGRDWLALARTRATPEALKKLPETADPIVTSPLTIAMPKQMAEALGWPEQRIGWKDLAQWAQDPQDFWAERGQRQWGALKLGKTNPHYSTSGLNATVGAFYARTGTSAELSLKDIDDPANQALVREIEKSVVHYGDDTLTFLSNLRVADDEGGPDRAVDHMSAVTVEEAAVVAYNQGFPCGSYSTDSRRECARTSPPTTPLVSLYPKDSNPESDHPYVVLNGLPSVKQTVALDFLAHLHSRPVFDKYFAPYGFRTHEREPGSAVTPANGALPETELSAYRAPQGQVLDRIQQAWSRLRRPANVLVVIDTSLSMEDKVPGTGKTKMELLKEAEPALFGGFSDADRVGLWRFSNAANIDGEHHYQPLVPIGPMSDELPGEGVPRREQLTREVKGLVPNGATGLYGTLDAAVTTLRAGYRADAINAIVLLTDGRNEGVPEKPTLQDVLTRIEGPGERIRVFTIAYGSDADEQDAGGRTVLEKLAAAGGGRAYDAHNPKVISEVLTSVISNF
ncbi:substrate-binding domain-containing protein [Streptomyces sp. NPDC018693]|uniref:phosphorylase family protein n=1 Tax=unclassified Streptomyces TaxID=2593676 RepID=UPI00379885F8